MLNLKKIILENTNGVEIILDTSRYCPDGYRLPCKHKNKVDCYGLCTDCWIDAIKSIEDFGVEWENK